MFGKKKCSHCSKKIDRGFDFCPYCASPMNGDEDYGLLGKDDNFDDLNRPIFKTRKESDGFLDKLFESAFKIVEKQIKKISEEELKNMQNNRRTGINPANSAQPDFKLFINGRQVNLPGNIAGFQVQEINGNGANNRSMIPKQPITKIPKVSTETIKKSAKLPRKEAKTKLTRTAERVIYELNTPGIDSLNNVLVNKLENSI